MTPLERLARVRTRLAMVRGSHVLLGSGCACGLAAGHIDVSGVDAMIARHLAEKYRTGGQTTLASLLERATEADSLSAVFETVINVKEVLSEVDCTLLCEDVETSVGSLRDMTRGKSGSGLRAEGL